MAEKRGWPDWVKGICLYGMAPNGDLILIRTDEQGNLTVNLIPHHTTHEAGGSDEIDVTGLKGVLANLQKAKWSVYDTRANFPAGEEVGALAYAIDEKTLYRWDGTSWVKVLSLDLMQLVNRLHAATHESGGDDPIDFLKLTNRFHAAKHQSGGDDEINVTGLHGELADPQTPKAHASTHEAGGSDEISVDGLHGELADPQTPKTHASTHGYGGTDPISQLDTAEKLSDLLPRNGSRVMTGNLLGEVGDHRVREIGRLGCSISGFDNRGAGYILPGCWDRMLFLTKRGGSVTATVSPDFGSLENIFSGKGDYARWPNSSLPVTVTITTEVDYLYCRDFFIHWHPCYAPKEFKVRLKKSDGTLLKEVHETDWPSNAGTFVIAGANPDLYYTRKIEIEIIQGPSDHSYTYLFEVVWLYPLGTTVVEPALYRGGGDMYGDINMHGNDILSPGLVDGVDVSSHASRHHSGGADPIYWNQLAINGDPNLNGHKILNPEGASGGMVAGVKWVDAVVYNGNPPSSWTLLDLSGYVGDRRALCVFRIDRPNATQSRLYQIAPADAYNMVQDAGFALGPNSCYVKAGGYGYIISLTDSQGRVRIRSESAESTDKVRLLCYFTVT